MAQENIKTSNSEKLNNIFLDEKSADDIVGELELSIKKSDDGHTKLAHNISLRLKEKYMT